MNRQKQALLKKTSIETAALKHSTDYTDYPTPTPKRQAEKLKPVLSL